MDEAVTLLKRTSLNIHYVLSRCHWVLELKFLSRNDEEKGRKPERLLENLGAAEVGLTDDEVAKVDELLNGLDLMVFGGHAVR